MNAVNSKLINDSTIDAFSLKIISNSKDKLRKTIYRILTRKEAKKDSPITEKWKKNYQINIQESTLHRTIAEIKKMHTYQRHKEKILRHTTQTYLKIPQLLRLNIIANPDCRDCNKKLDWEHILFTCPVAQYIWALTTYHIENIYRINLPKNITLYFLPNLSLLNKQKLEKMDKEDIVRLLRQTIISLHSRFFNKNSIFDKHCDAKLMNFVNKNIIITRYFNKYTLLKTISYVNFPRNMTNLKSHYESEATNYNESNLELMQNSFEVLKHDYSGKVIKTERHNIPQTRA